MAKESELTPEKCFFCDGILVPAAFDTTKENIEKWIAKYGSGGFNRIGGKIGKKPLCKSCVRDIQSCSQPEDY